jgi:hypothetical protein
MSAVSPRLVFNQSAPAFANGSPVASPELGHSRPMHPFSTVDIDQGMNKLATLLQGSSRVPTQRAAELASEWLYLAFDRANKLGGWRQPHISSTEDEEVVFEWWHKDRNLTLYFGEHGAEYIEVWGPDMENEMLSGPLTNWSFSNAWLRLLS